MKHASFTRRPSYIQAGFQLKTSQQFLEFLSHSSSSSNSSSSSRGGGGGGGGGTSSKTLMKEEMTLQETELHTEMPTRKFLKLQGF
jgi:hypothetical protein